jgi:hypothetical protein
MRAAVGLVIETPVSLVADVITMGGACVERSEPYTVSALRGVMRNVSDATKPEEPRR